MAAPLTGESPSESERLAASGSPMQREDAAQLKARLLRMIVNNEQSRKSAANEAFNGR
jgi:hypothetical protein